MNGTDCLGLLLYWVAHDGDVVREEALIESIGVARRLPQVPLQRQARDVVGPLMLLLAEVRRLGALTAASFVGCFPKEAVAVRLPDVGVRTVSILTVYTACADIFDRRVFDYVLRPRPLEVASEWHQPGPCSPAVLCIPVLHVRDLSEALACSLRRCPGAVEQVQAAV